MNVIGSYLGDKSLDIGVQVPVWTDVVWDQTTHLQDTPNSYTTYSEPYARDGLVIDNSTDWAVPARFSCWVLKSPQNTQVTQAAALYEVTGTPVNVSDWKRNLTAQLNQNPRYQKWV